MAPADRLHRPYINFWIPIWLYVPGFLKTDGQPRPILRVFRSADLCLSFLGLLLSAFGTIVLHTQWERVDAALCPNIVPCKDNACLIKADPDITGIGVRIATYVQALCGTILLGFSSKDTAGIRATIVVTSLALVTTTAVYAMRSELSLHHAVIVQSLLTLVLLPMHIVEPWRVDSAALFFAQQIRFGAYLALSFWLNVKTPCLGSTSQCNMCTKRTAYFFYTNHAVSRPLRASNVFTLFFICTLWGQGQWWTYGPMHYVKTVPALLSDSRAKHWRDYVIATHQSLSDWRREFKKRTPRRSQPMVAFVHWWSNEDTVSAWLEDKRQELAPGLYSTWFHRVRIDTKIAVRVPRAQRALVGVILVILYTVATERSVKMNFAEEANAWGFGQIASLILTMPAVASLLKLVMRLGRRGRPTIGRPTIWRRNTIP